MNNISKTGSAISIQQALAHARLRLHDKSESADLDATILLAAVMDVNQTVLYTWPDKKMSP